MFIYAISHLKPYFNQIGVLQNGIETLKKHVSMKTHSLNLIHTQHVFNFEFKRCFVNKRSSSKTFSLKIMNLNNIVERHELRAT